jgi:AraC-like DNA-binding protein
MEDMERVKAFVRASIRQIRSIDDIAKAFNLSQETLRKDFVRHEKTRLSQFVSEARVEEMKRLLSVTAQRCSEICLGVGFAREEVGERVFKRRVGMTMMEYRKSGQPQTREEGTGDGRNQSDPAKSRFECDD